ncbi:helix-turn-helix domain-containing protein [Parapedobacter sp. GCM10030251]|uniref:helix-turn-helix domain-containing protein n=1 Tax=Parapedobacter sp. GCM10030251 TaxID=3273419 RepID=UPI00360C02AF
METGNIIQALRKDRGWSQGELATESGVSREMIGKYERGDAVPSIEAAKKLARALGVTLDYLGGEADGPAFDRKTAERMKDIDRLDAAEREHVFALLDAFLAKSKMQAILK